ncbi:hypothetical protein AB1046_08030 [Promicromonospora sp. Populi]|uniref:hypothetical protein n=1 Tax=Promicromonospora sp. Populi TaxID=3239420 RepID=UPI0034E2CD6F
MPASNPSDPTGPADLDTVLDTVLDALYARPLDEFIAARDDAARQVADSGDQLGAERIKRLPKPSVAAWVVNQVARDHADDVAALTAVGDELRAATQDRDRARLRALDHLRRERTDALVRAVRDAGEVGGRAVSAAVLDRLTETLTAAVMDADAAAAVRAGRLARALQHAGFGIVDEQGEEADLVALRPASVTGSDDGARAGGPGSDAAGSDAAGTEAGDADADAEAAERAVEETSAQVDRLEADRDEVRERLRTADAAAKQSRSEAARLDRELARLTAERDTARRSVKKAELSAEEARAELDSVEDQLDDAVERAAEARRRRRAARGR